MFYCTRGENGAGTGAFATDIGRAVLAVATQIGLHGLGILLAGELLTIGDAHHIRVNFQAIAVGIVEIKRATAAATEIPATLKTVDQWTIHQLDPLGMQMRQGFEKLVAVFDLKGEPCMTSAS